MCKSPDAGHKPDLSHRRCPERATVAPRRSSIMRVREALIAVMILVPSATAAEPQPAAMAHGFEFTAIEGEPLSMAIFKGKAVLVVNTASRCGFTHQYGDLQAVWERYRDRGLVVLGVPSNDFGGQEPGTEAKIKEFCEVNFNVDFPMTTKVRVRGYGAHPFYRWAAEELGSASKPRWNFHKYLIAPDGRLVDWFATSTSPTSERVLRSIEAHLPKPGKDGG